MQLQSGYFFENVKKEIVEFIIEVYKSKLENPKNINKTKEEIAKIVSSLFYNLSFFDIEANVEFNEETESDPTLSVLNNIISRGLPTRMPVDLAEEFSDAFDFINKELDEKSIEFTIDKSKNGIIKLIYLSLHVVDSRLDNQNILNHFENYLDSESEGKFLENLSSKFEHLIQLIEPQTEFSDFRKNRKLKNFNKIKDYDKSLKDEDKDRIQYKLLEGNVDFSLEFPYEPKNKKTEGLVIEVDGPHHEQKKEKQHDEKRDKALNELNRKIERIKTDELDYESRNEFFEKLESHLDEKNVNKYFEKIKENYNTPLYDKKLGSEAMQVVLSPFAIARVQKTILKFLQNTELSLEDDCWNICVIERDVPCAKLALRNLKELVSRLYRLQGKNGFRFPELDLSIINTDEFSDCELNKNLEDEISGKVNSFQKIEEQFDLVLDVSVLRKNCFDSKKHKFDSKYYGEIRSSYFPKTKRQFQTSNLIEYSEVTDENKEDLKYFLQSIFRKRGFINKQFEILQRTLQAKSAIALMPTGAGKSLTYQMSALLQPGISLIIDPINSLMKDQRRSLSEYKIDAHGFINSTELSRNNSGEVDEKSNMLNGFKEGRFLFYFISPERMQIEDFRNTLEEMYDQGLYFSYGVMDEAHCVSEWGHDFRTSYLKLGENLMNFCKRKDGKKNIPLVGLTATASFDVLTDIQREISTKDKKFSDEVIIRDQNVNRDELNFRIKQVNLNEDEIKNESNSFELRELLSARKIKEIKSILKEVPQEIIELDKNTSEEDKRLNKLSRENFYKDNQSAGVVFVPHSKGCLGVTDKYKNTEEFLGVYDKIKKDKSGILENLNLGFYRGGRKKNETGSPRQKSIVNQEKFLNNEQNLMVCTKAFGMGIDKDNIRFTVHMNYPDSIEGFIQEAGRAGRDGKTALSYVLFNDQELLEKNKGGKVSIDEETWLFFYNKSFPGEKKEAKKIENVLREIKNQSKTKGHVTIKWRSNNEQERLAKAIYRLNIIGCIKDYVVHYKENCFELRDVFYDYNIERYKLELKSYLRNYWSEDKIGELLENLTNDKNYLFNRKTKLHKYLNFLIYFIYDQVAVKRRRNIKEMKDACTKYIEKSRKNGDLTANQSFKEYIFHYFNSKYARSSYNPDGEEYSLLALTEKGRKEDINIVWKYIDEILDKDRGSIETNLKHLRGACSRLITDKGDNLTLLLLRSYSVFMLEGIDSDLISQANDDLKKGFRNIAEKYGSKEYFSIINQYKERIKNNINDKLIKKSVLKKLNILRLKKHRKNLNNFTNNYLKKYEPTK